MQIGMYVASSVRSMSLLWMTNGFPRDASYSSTNLSKEAWVLESRPDLTYTGAGSLLWTVM